MPDLPLSEDAALVLALAGTAIRFADSPRGEAEQWVRILRMHGEVGSTMQAIGVGEKPLDPNEPLPERARTGRRFARGDVSRVAQVRTHAAEIAAARSSELVGTVDVLRAVGELYGDFDDVLYARGTTLDELFERLAAAPEERSAARQL